MSNSKRRVQNERRAWRRGSAPRRIVVIALAMGIFFAFGFLLPTLFSWAATSIATSLDSNGGSAEPVDVPLGLSLLLGALLAVGAAAGLLLDVIDGPNRRRSR
jgi:hypothetical protein